VSAVSGPVADVLSARYATRPTVVHNCHPWADRSLIDGEVLDRRGPAMSLFWFSQTIGPDRGLEGAIRAASRLPRPAQIHLRGSVSGAVRAALERLARDVGMGHALFFHPPCPPDELLSRAAEHDVGLALELPDSLSRRLSVTNKLFLYLTAGLAVLATDLPGQRSVLSQCPEAGALHAPGDDETLGAQLTTWALAPDRLQAAKRAALAAAERRWNAETEGRALIGTVGHVLGATRSEGVAGVS
jgi:glycosyltransferase involved in cell wall biosynthesis